MENSNSKPIAATDRDHEVKVSVSGKENLYGPSSSYRVTVFDEGSTYKVTCEGSTRWTAYLPKEKTVISQGRV